MKVVAIASVKAGNGKSRLTWDLLVALADAGIETVGIDCCPSQDLTEHNRIRGENNYGALAVFSAATPVELTRVLFEQGQAGFNVALIDAPIGDPATVTRPFLAAADVTLVTVQPTLEDIIATAPLVRPLVKAGKAFHYLLVRTPNGGAAYDKNFLAKLGMTLEEAKKLLLPVTIASRPVMINDLNANGIGVIEALGNARVDQEAVGQASMEIRSIRQYLRDELDF